jgi:hypothetical protein
MSLGGGGGGGTSYLNGGAIGGVGGIGIGGSGNSTGGPGATSGAANTGSGGGGGGDGSDGGSGVFIISYLFRGSGGGTITMSTLSSDLRISAANNLVLSPGVGLSGLIISNLASVASATPTGFYRLLYNPTTGQIAYGTDLSP